MSKSGPLRIERHQSAVAPPRHPPRHTPTCAPSPLNLRGLWTQESLGKSSSSIVALRRLVIPLIAMPNAQCPSVNAMWASWDLQGPWVVELLDSQRVGFPLRYNAILAITARLQFTTLRHWMSIVAFFLF